MDFFISFIFPSMSRPEKFFATLENMRDKILNSENYEVICILEETDLTMNCQTVTEKISTFPNVKPFYITSTGKINAINIGIEFISKQADIIVLVADDIFFTETGFDEHIRADMQQYYSDLSGCLHYGDGQVGDRQITMPVIGKNLLLHFGYIYHSSYFSVWADNEMLQVYKILNKVKYIHTSLYKHIHPAWGLAQTDDLYKRNENFYHIDSDNYFKRLAINFDL